MPSDVLTTGAARAARMLRAGELSSTELVGSLIRRIEEVNPEVNAIRVVMAERALAEAALADRRLTAGRPVGPLDGVPVTIKENIDVEGTATTQGCAALADVIVSADAPAVAHLRRAGAIVLARTNMPDLALRWHTDSGVAGATRNPWDPALTPGGSSGGEAVALATGMSLLGVGTDLGGSLRWPSQCAGTAALRPSLGRIAQTGADNPIGLQLLDVTGPMARRVEDLRVALHVMSAPDVRDPWHSPVDAAYAPDLPRRVHVLTDLGVPLAPAVSSAVHRAAEALSADGYEIHEEPPPGLATLTDIWAGLVIGDARRAWPALSPLVSADAARFMDAMFDLVPVHDLDAHSALLVERQRLGRAWARYQRATPLVLAPIHAGGPFPVGADLGGTAAAREIVSALRATLVANVLGLPAVAVPVGFVDGLPQAVQIIGPRFGEEACLRAAETVEVSV